MHIALSIYPMSDENAALVAATNARTASIVHYIETIKRKFDLNSTVYGVSPSGVITEGRYIGFTARPDDAEYRYIIETERNEVFFQVDEDNIYRRTLFYPVETVYFPLDCVFKTRAEAEARANDFRLRYFRSCP